MISASLLERVACPVCLEPEGCAVCSGRGHDGCAERYASRVACVCGGPDKVRLVDGGDALECPCCRTRYRVDRERGYVELVPRQSVGEVTHYADHEFHERLGVTEAPPLLSAGIKFEWMRRLLDLRPGESVLDLGSGAGKFVLACTRRGLKATGVDVAPFFLPGAEREVDLVVGDLRRLPFRKASFPAAYSLDVLEHLDEAGVREVLLEVRRVLGDEGRLLVYTHAMESSRLAAFQRGVNRLARRLGEAGWIDHEREAMRKSDHKNPIRSHEHFDALCAEAGLTVVERRYYNVVAKAVVEDLALRLFQHLRARRKAQTGPSSTEGSTKQPAPPEPRALSAPMPGRGMILVGRVLTWILALDMILFGRVRTGPFFGLIRSSPRPLPPAVSPPAAAGGR
jgi:ubiquinone/menaquinone biosynthesis C-methylase UbiE